MNCRRGWLDCGGRVGQIRVPHKPLLPLWLFGQFAATGSSVASDQQAEEPVSQLINDFGPPVASPAAVRQRATMPFVHLERELWELGTPPEGKSARMRPNAAPGCWSRERAVDALAGSSVQCNRSAFTSAAN